jgi:Bacterial extracellular solute-binding proteins, family 3
MKCCSIFWGLVLGLAVATNSVAATGKLTDVYIAYPEVRDPEEPVFYYQQVLRLALEKTRQTHGDFRLHFSDQFYSLGRATQMLVNNQHADVMWASVTAERKEFMQLIDYDLLRGLSNYRVLIIKADKQKRFNSIKTFKQFKRLSSGSGSNWTATAILRMNGINVSTATEYALVLKMLAAGRFDYISRGLHEAQSDIALSDALGLDLAIESSILLQYQHPIAYSFFVSKQNTAMAERLREGIRIAEEDGSLFAAFSSMKLLRDASQFINQNRKVFTLKNRPLAITENPARKLSVNPQ